MKTAGVTTAVLPCSSVHTCKQTELKQHAGMFEFHTSQFQLFVLLRLIPGVENGENAA